MVGKAHLSYPGNVTQGYKDSVLAWQRLARAHIKGNVGYVPGLIAHDHHGPKRCRRYHDRWQILARNQFNPFTDLRIAKWMKGAGEHIHEALEYAKGREVVVQAGAHVGIWPWLLESYFRRVYTFEADAVNYECAARNLDDFLEAEVTLTKAALGARGGTLPWYRSISNTGKHRPNELGRGKTAGTVAVVTIDSLDLPACDLICLDIEGYEQAALKGGTATIEKYRPVVLIEDMPHAPWHGLPLGGAQKWLEARGYRLATRVGEDQIWVPA
jgi:FkbM family methyltransferase